MYKSYEVIYMYIIFILRFLNKYYIINIIDNSLMLVITKIT